MNNRLTKCLIMLALALSALTAQATPDAKGIVWQDVRTWGIEGRGWRDGLEHYYDRLPLRARSIVGPGAWEFSRHSAGMTVRFSTNATTIHVRYRLSGGKIGAFPDMSAT